MIYDIHCHLDFSPEGVHAAQQLHGRVAAVSNTVTPEGFQAAADAFAASGNVHIGLGLHPWQAEAPDFARQLEAFEALAPQCPFVGEVGLDFSARRTATREQQCAAFDRVVRACTEPCAAASPSAGGIVSIHAVQAVDQVIDAFDRVGALGSLTEPASVGGRALVLHSFNGTSDQLHRAVRAGFFFSVGPRLLATKRGRAYVRAIPDSRLLLETDLPAHAGEAFSADRWLDALEGALHALADARGESPDAVAATVAQTSERLFGASPTASQRHG